MQNKFSKFNSQSGAAMLVSVIFFLFLCLAIITGLVAPTVREFKNSRINLNSKQSYFLAESGSEDAVYRTLTGKTIGTSETISLNNNSVTTSISTLFGNSKQITSLSDIFGYQRKTSISLDSGAGVAFNYGLQAGNGGVNIDGGSTVNGNIYSNANINAISATINGTAVAADSPSLSLDQKNDTPATPTSSINFRDVSASQDFAQSFQVSSSTPLNKVQFYIKKVGSPADATLRLVADNSGSPSTTTIPIGTVSLTASSVSTTYGWVEVAFTSYPSLMAGITYWVVLDNSTQNASNYYVIGANTDSTYTSGTAKVGSYSGSWTTTSLDSYFKIYIGGMTSKIGGAGYVGGVQIGTGGTGDAWARTVQGASVSGNLYCNTGTNNNKACNTTHGNAPAVMMSSTEQSIAE